MTSQQTPDTVLDDWARSSWPLMTQLAEHRRIANITREQVAEAVGVKYNAVYRWESGQKSPKFAYLLRFAARVGRRVALWDGTRIVAEDADIPAALKSVREAAELSQRDLAALMHVVQSAVVMRETRGCVRVSSMEDYLRPLGARLILLPGDREAVAS